MSGTKLLAGGSAPFARALPLALPCWPPGLEFRAHGGGASGGSCSATVAAISRMGAAMAGSWSASLHWAHTWVAGADCTCRAVCPVAGCPSQGQGRVALRRCRRPQGIMGSGFRDQLRQMPGQHTAGRQRPAPLSQPLHACKKALCVPGTLRSPASVVIGKQAKPKGGTQVHFRAMPVVEERRAAQLRQHLHGSSRMECQLVRVSSTFARQQRRAHLSCMTACARWLRCCSSLVRDSRLALLRVPCKKPDNHGEAGWQNTNSTFTCNMCVLQGWQATLEAGHDLSTSAHHRIDGARGVKQRVQQQRRARPGRQAGRDEAPVRGRQRRVAARGRLQRTQRRAQRGRRQRSALQGLLCDANLTGLELGF